MFTDLPHSILTMRRLIVSCPLTHKKVASQETSQKEDWMDQLVKASLAIRPAGQDDQFQDGTSQSPNIR